MQFPRSRRSALEIRVASNPAIHLAHAYAETLGSAPALTVPVLASTITAASELKDHGPGARCGNLCPFAASAAFTVSEIRDSTERSPGYIVCGNGDAGKLRVAQRGASIAC